MEKIREELVEAYKTKNWSKVKKLKRSMFKEIAGDNIDLLLKLIEADEMLEDARLEAFKESQAQDSI